MRRATHESVRCTAHSSRTGVACKRWATIGSSVCSTHGAAAPQVKQAAAERLMALVDPAITRMHQLMLAADQDSVSYRAAADLLDRAGFKAPEKIDLNATVSYSRLSDEELEARIAALEGRARRLPPASGRAKPPSVSD